MKIQQGLLLGLFISTQSFATSLPEGMTHIACNKTAMRCTAIGTITLDRNHCPFGCLQPISSYSMDGKKTWSASQYMPKTELEMVYFNSFTCNDDGMNCIVVGHQMHSHLHDILPLLFSTNDGGKHWEVQNYAGANYCSYHSASYPWRSWGKLYDHTCDKSGKNCVAVGSCVKDDKTDYSYVGLSIISRDGGLTWQESSTQPLSVMPHNELNKVTCDENAMKCIATGTAKYESDDGGDNWRLVS